MLLQVQSSLIFVWRSFLKFLRFFALTVWKVSNFFAWDGNQLLQLWTDQINNSLINSFVGCKQSLDLWKLNLVFNIYFKTKLNKSQSLNLFTISWKNYVRLDIQIPPSIIPGKVWTYKLEYDLYQIVHIKIFFKQELIILIL